MTSLRDTFHINNISSLIYLHDYFCDDVRNWKFKVQNIIGVHCFDWALCHNSIILHAEKENRCICKCLNMFRIRNTYAWFESTNTNQKLNKLCRPRTACRIYPNDYRIRSVNMHIYRAKWDQSNWLKRNRGVTTESLVRAKHQTDHQTYSNHSNSYQCVLMWETENKKVNI